MNAKKLAVALAAGIAALCAVPAQATLTLSLQSGSGPVTSIVDNSALDIDPTANRIKTSGVFSGWSYNFEMGKDNAPGGIPTEMKLDADVEGSGSLTITLTEDAFYVPSYHDSIFDTSVAGTTTFTSGSPVSAEVWLGTTQLGSTMTPGLSPGGLLNSEFGQKQLSYGDTSSTPFTLQQVLKITHSGVGQTDTNIRTGVVPEPAMLGLIGLALLGLGFIRRKTAKA